VCHTNFFLSTKSHRKSWVKFDFCKEGKAEEKKKIFLIANYTAHTRQQNCGRENNKNFFFFGLGNDPNNFLKRKREKIRGGSAICFFKRNWVLLFNIE
jgi:hypothetical protein